MFSQWKNECINTWTGTFTSPPPLPFLFPLPCRYSFIFVCLQVFNLNFHEVFSVSAEMHSVLCMVFNHSKDELITGGTGGMKVNTWCYVWSPEISIPPPPTPTPHSIPHTTPLEMDKHYFLGLHNWNLFSLNVVFKAVTNILHRKAIHTKYVIHVHANIFYFLLLIKKIDTQFPFSSGHLVWLIKTNRRLGRGIQDQWLTMVWYWGEQSVTTCIIFALF